jgi:hypothetical protein
MTAEFLFNIGSLPVSGLVLLWIGILAGFGLDAFVTAIQVCFLSHMGTHHLVFTVSG